MAQIGHGYGSEWQLLRMLGHHRNEFFEKLKEELNIKDDINWLDYPYDNKSVSGDGEYFRLNFINNPNFPKFLKSKIEKIKKPKDFLYDWNWDGIFCVGEELYVVEAKANIEEVRSDCKAENADSIASINTNLKELKKHFAVQSESDWSKKYYQFANRLAFIKLMKDYGIKAKLVNIYFINGYIHKIYFPDTKEWREVYNKSASRDNWSEVIKKEKDYLGLNGNEEINKVVKDVFIDCIQP